jgi:hypothetical protein
MNNYYLVSWKHKSELVSAFSLQQKSMLDTELIPSLFGKKNLPFHFELKRVKESQSGLIVNDSLLELSEIWLDYQPNNLAWPLMSERLKSVIDNNLTGNEAIDWIECKVIGLNDVRSYYILRFNKLLDVLDINKTLFVDGTDHIIKPVFDLQKITVFSIFPKPLSDDLWRITPGIYISEKLKKQLQKEKMTGLDFEKVSVS